MTAVAGLDLSLTATGVVTAAGDPILVRAPDLRGERRLDYLAGRVRALTEDADLVVIEGYAFGRVQQAHALGELGGVVRWMLWRVGKPFKVMPPSALKMYATGKGNAGKPDMLAAAIKRLGVEFTDDNLVDAAWLRVAGLDMAGEPLVAMPEANRKALGALLRR